MKQNTFRGLILLALLIALLVVGVSTDPARSRSLGDISNADGLWLDGSFGTATPQLRINNQGSGKSIEVLSTAGAVVFSVGADGAINAAGVLTNSAANNLVVNVPTAQATTIAGLYMDNLSAGASSLDIRDSGTPQVQVYNGGGVKVAAPTAVATTVPVLLLQGQGASNQFEIRDAAGTPVASFGPSGSPALPASSIDSTEIANVSRSVNVPLSAFIDCQTDAGALIGFDTTADALPDYVNSATDGTGYVIRFDDTSGTEDQSAEVCSQLSVPAGYASGGAFVIRAKKDAHAGATEVINCAVSVNGAALETVGTVTTSASASTSYTCTPTIAALAAGDSLSFYLSITSGATMDDVVDVASVEFQYTAVQ